MGLPLARVAGDGDVEAVRVLDRLRGEGHREALRDGPVADVALVEGVEEEGEGVAVLEDRKGTLVMLILHWCRGKGGCLLPLSLLLLPGLVHPPELRPALGASAAARMVAAGEDGAVRELDGEGTVFMCRRERALGEGEEGAPLPGPCAPDGDPVLREPGSEVDAGAVFPLRRLFPGEEPGEVLQPFPRDDTDFVRYGEQPRPPVRPLRGGLSPFRDSVP
jgi:hypothetical protein